MIFARKPRRSSSLGPFASLALLVSLLAAACAPHKPAEAIEWSSAFERKDGFGWSGGDAADSVPLPNNRILWLFGDSYLGGVANGRRNQVELRFGNTIAIQENAAGNTPPLPQDLRFDWGPAGSNGWLPISRELLQDPTAPSSAARALERNLTILSWPLHGVVVGTDLVLFNMPVTSTDCDGCGPLQFKIHGTVATVIRGVDRPYDQWGVHPGAGWDAGSQLHPVFVPHSHTAPALDDTTGLVWGTFLMRDAKDPGTIYIYGHREAKKVGTLAVARVVGVQRADDLLDFARWLFWDGLRWSPDPEASAAIATDSVVEASIVPVPAAEGGGFALVESGNMYAGEIRVALSTEPWGPFVDRYRLSLADCPVAGFDPAARQLTYAAKAHPELSNEDELLVSVVTMPLDAAGPVSDPHQYAPRFMSLPWAEIESFGHSSADRCGSQ